MLKENTNKKSRDTREKQAKMLPGKWWYSTKVLLLLLKIISMPGTYL